MIVPSSGQVGSVELLGGSSCKLCSRADSTEGVSNESASITGDRDGDRDDDRDKERQGA
jgi:hypothetical protein